MLWGEIVAWTIVGLLVINTSYILTKMGRKLQWNTTKIISVDAVFVVSMVAMSVLGYAYFVYDPIVCIER